METKQTCSATHTDEFMKTYVCVSMNWAVYIILFVGFSKDMKISKLPCHDVIISKKIVSSIKIKQYTHTRQLTAKEPL